MLKVIHLYENELKTQLYGYNNIKVDEPVYKLVNDRDSTLTSEDDNDNQT
jgi:hypothetical protein